MAWRLDYCVKATALQLVGQGFNTVLNLAARRGITKDSTARAIEEMRSAGAIVIEHSEALEQLK